MSEPPDLTTPLVAYPWVLVRLRCHVCPRNAEVRMAALAARYGHRVPVRTVLHAFMGEPPINLTDWPNPFLPAIREMKRGCREEAETRRGDRR